MEEIGVSVASKVAEGLVDRVVRACSYMIFHARYLRELEDEVASLDRTRQKVQHSVDEAQTNMKPIEAVVEQWTTDAKSVADKVSDMRERYKEAEKTYFCGWLPNPKTRYHIVREARETVKAIQDLIPKGEFNKVYYENAPPGYVADAPDVSSSAGDGGKTMSKSQASILEDIMNALEDEKFKVVGVYGPGGVGKSTLLKEVEKKLKSEKRLFDVIAKATVSQTGNLRDIQDDIAYALSLDLTASKVGRADLLSKGLQSILQSNPKKKVLIILDDLWEKLDLEAVGISSGDESKGCKLLITSRFKNVLDQKMHAEPTFRLEGLKNDEAFKLFQMTIGDKLIGDEDLTAKAAQVVGKLAGLPLLITSIASTLKCSDVSTWDTLLIKVEDSDIKKIVKLSYDHLESEDAKSLFLLCGLIGGTIQVETLLGLGLGLGLFERFNKTMKDARARLNATLDSLRSICLLEDGGDDKKNVTIHDLYSEVVVSIPFGGQNSLMIDSNYGSWPKEKLEKCGACLVNVGSDRLAELMRCGFPDLKILMVSEQHDRLNFSYMKELRVLYFPSMDLTSLPSSIGILENLHSLYLDRCSVEDVAILGKLKALRILSFTGSTISRLPKEIGELTNLQSLNLSNCDSLKIIEPGALKGLINLEELHMKKSFNEWMGKDEILSESCGVGLAELKSLTKLASLEISIGRPIILLEDGDLPFGNLIRFWINIGNVDYRGFEGLTTMKLNLEGCDNILSREWVQKALQKTQYLNLCKLSEFKKSAHELCTQGFRELKHLHIDDSPSIKYIANSSDAFMKLESLRLENLINLEKIYHGPIAPECFSKLKAVSVKRCDRLKYLWRLSDMQRFVQLEEIKVQECDSMQSIVTDDAGEEIVSADNRVELPNVRRLVLGELPNMTSFCSKAEITSEDTLIQVPFPRLESLVMVGLLDLEKILYGQPPLEYSNLKSIEIEESKSTSKSILKSDWILKMPNLESLDIEGSPSAEAVFDLEELKVTGHVQILSRLMELTIRHSPNLRRMWKQDVKLQGISVFRSLKELMVGNTGLTFLFPVSVAKCLREIRNIQVVDCPNMKAVIVDDEGRDEGTYDVIEFPLLEGLRICNCPMEKFFSYPHGNKDPVTATSDSQDAYSDSFFDQKCRNFGMFIRSPTSVERPLGETAEVDDESPQAFFNEMARFPNIRSLYIKGAQCKELWNNQIPIGSFCKLKSLKLIYCDNLLRIAPSRTWKRLQCYLETLTVDSCRSIEIIFGSDGYAEKSGNMRRLILRDLDKLRHIWQYDGLLEGGEIRGIDVHNCPNMKAVIAYEEGRGEGIDDIIEFPQLESLLIFWCPTDKFFSYPRGKKQSVTSTSDSQDAYSDSFFDPKVSLPSLKTLYFYQVRSFQRIWHGDLPKSSFCELATLSLDFCSDLLNVFPSTIIGRLHNLRSVKVEDCPSLESLFDCGSLDANTEQTTVLLPKLERVEVWAAGKLRSLVKGESQTNLGFPSLEVVRVDNCSDMKYLFPHFTATTLEKLKRINISQCEQMKEVVLVQEGGRSKEEVMRFPSLEYLSISQCRNFGAFIRSPTSVKRQLDEMAEKNDESPQPLFNEMVTFPNIRELEIEDVQCKELWNNQIPTDSFCKLESLELKKCDNLRRIAPSHMWKRLQRCLEILQVISCLSIEIVYEGDGTDTESGKLRRLVLRDLENLRHIWQSDGLPNVPFPNLRDVEAVRCSRLEMLFTTFTAKFLGHIEELVVESCENMKLIAEHEKRGGATCTRITFSKLTVLRLFELPKFNSFLPEEYSLKFPYSEDFPSLRDLSIVRCGSEGDRGIIVDDWAIHLADRRLSEIRHLANID